MYILNKYARSFISGTNARFNAINMTSSYSNVLLIYLENIHIRAKYAAFTIMCHFPGKNIKLTKCPYVLIFCRKGTVLFFINY